MPHSMSFGSIVAEPHKTTHQDTGSDEISVAALSGQLADNQPSTWALVSGKPSTFTPELHKASHQDGGSDEINLTGLIPDAVLKARANRTAAYTLVQTTWTKWPIDTVNFDPDSIVDLVNQRITPNKPGYYLVIGQVGFVSSSSYLIIRLYKNGAYYVEGPFSPTVSTGNRIEGMHDIIYFNGTTDYIELFYWTDDAGRPALLTGTQNFLELIGPF